MTSTIQEWRRAIGIAPLSELKRMREITIEEIRRVNLKLDSRENREARTELLARLRLINESHKRLKAREHRKRQELESENKLARDNSGLSFSKMFVQVVKERLAPEAFQEFEKETARRLVQRERENGNK